MLAQTVVTPLYGKLGDLYGRKRVLQSAIVIFLAARRCVALSADLDQLIAFRAIQGLGRRRADGDDAGDVGDVVSPRERGRYMGIFGAVFGLAELRVRCSAVTSPRTGRGAGSSTSTCRSARSRWRRWCDVAAAAPCAATRDRLPGRGVPHRVSGVHRALSDVGGAGAGGPRRCSWRCWLLQSARPSVFSLIEPRARNRCCRCRLFATRRSRSPP
jgi:hypothetical protein